MRRIVRPGEMRSTVVIQTRSTTQNSFGEEPDTWTDTATVRAKIMPLRGREGVDALHAQGETTLSVRMRYHSGLTQKSRIKFGSRYLYVEQVLNIDEMNRYIEAICVERDA